LASISYPFPTDDITHILTGFCDGILEKLNSAATCPVGKGFQKKTQKAAFSMTKPGK